MNLSESIRVALEGLAANKVRSALTMLGIVIGVGAVIAMIAIGQGAQRQTMKFIESMGANTLSIFSGQSRSGMVRGGMGSAQTLTYDDAIAIGKECSAVIAVAPEASSQAQVKYKNMNTSTQVMGTSPDYPSVRNYKIAKGKFFVERDVSSMRRVAVVGPTTAENLFGLTSPLNKVIRVNGINFKIIGVTASKGSTGFMDQDDVIFVPVTTAMKRLTGEDALRSISVQGRDRDSMDEASSQIETLLRKRHKIGPMSKSDFMIRNQAEFQETAEQTSQTFTMLLAGIAAVSLLVGGIGIMNIMLVSVTERTREIGIRKAVGARRRDILLQFLIESVVLSLVGGIIGIVFGIGSAVVISHTGGWPVSISIASVIMAFVFAAAVGIFFGIYPARKASCLRPIDALRYE